MIKLIATDLDGTLFYPKRRLTLLEKSNKKFLIDFYNAGGKIVLVTGRDRRISMKVQKKTGIDLAVLGCNGAFIYQDGKFIKSNYIPKSILFDVYMQLKVNYNVLGFLVFDETDQIKVSVVKKSIIPYLGIFINIFSGVYMEKYIVSEKEVVKDIANGTVFKLMPIFGLSKAAKIRALHASLALKEKYKNKLTINAASIALEITNAGVNKANTLLEYIEQIGIKKEEVAVIGDSYNDLAMFEKFENSFAMFNGEKVILDKASHIINKVSDIREFVLENGKLKK